MAKLLAIKLTPNNKALIGLAAVKYAPHLNKFHRASTIDRILKDYYKDRVDPAIPFCSKGILMQVEYSILYAKFNSTTIYALVLFVNKFMQIEQR